MTVTGTHNPSSVKICVIPALFPKTPTPPSTLAKVCNRAPLEEEEEDVVDEVIKEERALNEEDLREAKAEAEVAANVWASADIFLCVCVCVLFVYTCLCACQSRCIYIYLYVRKKIQIEFCLLCSTQKLKCLGFHFFFLFFVLWTLLSQHPPHQFFAQKKQRAKLYRFVSLSFSLSLSLSVRALLTSHERREEKRRGDRERKNRMEHQSSRRPPPPPRNEINHIRHVRKLKEEESLKKKKNNNNTQEKSFLENVFSNIFRSESIDEERENGEEERGRRKGEVEENKKNTKNANKQQQQQTRRTRQQKRREGEVNIDIDIDIDIDNNSDDDDAVANRTPPKSHEEKHQREDTKEDEEEEDTESKFSERLRNASGSAKFELERKAREEIRSIKGIKAKAKLIDSNEAVRTQALLRLKAKIDKHMYDERGHYVSDVPVNPSRAAEGINATVNATNAVVSMKIDTETAEDKLTPHQKKQRKEELRRIRERDDYRVRESVTSESRHAFNGSWNYDKDEFLREEDKYENQYYVEERKHKLLGGVLSAAEMNVPEHEQPLRIAENIVDTIVQCALVNNGKYEWKVDEEELRKREEKYEDRRKEEMKTMKKMLNADEISDDDDDDDDDYFEEEMRIHRQENKLLTEKLVKSIPDSVELIERMNIRREQIKAQKDKLKLKKTKQKYIDKIERQEKEIEETIAQAKILEAKMEEQRLEKERKLAIVEEERLKELKLKQLSEKELIRRHSEHKRKKIMEMHENERKKAERARLARQEARRVQEMKLKVLRETANLEVELKENALREETRRLEEEKLIEENNMHVEREMRNVMEKERRARSAATRHELCIQIKETREREHQIAMGKLRRKNSTAEDAENAAKVKEALKKAIQDVEETEKERIKTMQAKSNAYEKVKALQDRQAKHLQMKRLLDKKQKESEEAEYKAELENVRSSIQKAALRNSELKQTLSDFNKNLVIVYPKVENKPLPPPSASYSSKIRAAEKLKRRAVLET